MKIEDLKIGNWVHQEDYSDTDFVVKELIKSDASCGNADIVNCYGGKNGEWINPIELINPIKLDTDRMLQLNFEVIDNRWYNPSLIKGYIKQKKDAYFWSIYLNNTEIEMTELKAVHELQNLISIQ